MRQLTRDDLLKEAAKYGGVAFAAAAGGGTFARAAGATPTASDFKPSGTITIWQHQTSVFNSFFQKMSDTYQAQTGVKVENLYIPYASYETKVLTSYSSGTAPDIVKLGGWLFHYYASKGLFGQVNAQSFGRKDAAALQKYKFAKGTLDYFTYKNKYYGVPADINNLMLFYRKDDFKAAGLDPEKPPTTWSQVIAYGKKLTQSSGGKMTRAGFQWWWPAVPVWDYLQILALIEGQQGGHHLLSADGKSSQLNSKAGIYALDFYADMYLKHNIGSPRLTHPRNNYGLMASDQASMIVNASFVGNIINALSGGKVAVGKNVGVAPMPRFSKTSPLVNPGYLWGWGVNKQSRNAATAWHFLNFLLSQKHANTMLAAAGIVMPVKNFDGLPAARNDPLVAPMLTMMAKELPYTIYGPRLNGFNQMIQLLSDAMQSVVQGQASSSDAAKNFDSQMVQVLRT